jgi:hypothetical protein
MKIKKPLLVCLLLSLTIIGIWFLSRNNPPIFQKTINIEKFGDIAVAQPVWGSQGLTLVFADTGKFPARDLGQRLAVTGVTAAIVDSLQFFKGFNAETGQCLDARHVATFINTLVKELPRPPVNRLIVAGIAEGALIPFINAQSTTGNAATNLSIGFSVNLPVDLSLCPPSSTQHQDQKQTLASSPGLQGNWRSVWTDEPPTETDIFIKALGNVDTRIAAYDTPLDTLLVEELNTVIGHNGT